jgi:hypothetical protein
MNQWLSQLYVSEHSGSAELSADFLLRLVPIRPGESDSRLIGWAQSQWAEEVELEIEVAPCGEVVALHLHGKRYGT